MRSTIITMMLVFCYVFTKAQTDTLRVNLNILSITQTLLGAPHEVKTHISKSDQVVYLPDQDGKFNAFRLVEYDIVPQSLKKEIKTFYGQMINNPSVSCRITLSNGQINAGIFNSDKYLIIEKNKLLSSPNEYWVLEGNKTPPSCGVESHNNKNGRISGEKAVMFASHGTQLRTYKLALLVTNSFYSAGGGTNTAVNTYVTSIINNINGIFEREVAVRFVLVSPNNPVSSNLFYNFLGTTSLNNIISENDNRFGNANFDIGHCLESSGGGVAYLGVMCDPI